MRILALMILGLLVVGCGKDENAIWCEYQGRLEESKKQLMAEDRVIRSSIVGAYEGKLDGYTFRLVFLANGIVED